LKVIRVVVILLFVYVGIVVAFESLLGYFQPQAETTMIISTTDDEGNAHPRVVARLETDGRLYVAANHWPRVWYYQALENPDVKVTIDGNQGDYLAVQISDEEQDRVNNDHRLGTMFRVLTGFPPRNILRLDPVVSP
jgi:hypothetical protein